MNKQQRTDIILARNRGEPGEFTRLHAIICIDHGWDSAASVTLTDLFDGVQLAARLDEINAEFMKTLPPR